MPGTEQLLPRLLNVIIEFHLLILTVNLVWQLDGGDGALSLKTFVFSAGSPKRVSVHKGNSAADFLVTSRPLPLNTERPSGSLERVGTCF